MGWLKYHAKYLYFLIRYGLKNHPFEIDARKHQNVPLTKSERELKGAT